MDTISKKGFVVENKNGQVKVMVQRDTGCGSCSTCGGCEIKPSFITIHSNENLSAGDQVYLESDSKTVGNLTKFIYIFPVLMIFLFAFLANMIFKNSDLNMDLMTILFMLLGLGISFIGIRLLDNRYKNKNIVKLRKIE